MLVMSAYSVSGRPGMPHMYLIMNTSFFQQYLSGYINLMLRNNNVAWMFGLDILKNIVMDISLCLLDNYSIVSGLE